MSSARAVTASIEDLAELVEATGRGRVALDTLTAALAASRADDLATIAYEDEASGNAHDRFVDLIGHAVRAEPADEPGFNGQVAAVGRDEAGHTTITVHPFPTGAFEGDPDQARTLRIYDELLRVVVL